MREDFEILRGLARQIAEIAALPVQEEKRTLWRKLNGLNPVRPMATIDQICWNEMNYDGSLTEKCQSEELREWERQMRRTLFQWKHFPVDMVVESKIDVPMAIHDTLFGINVSENTLATDETNNVISHAYHNQFESDEALELIKMPVLTHDAAETERRLSLAHDVFDGILNVSPAGYDPYLSVWDQIATFMGMEGILYGLIDRPEFMRALAEKMVAGYMSKLDQAEKLGVLVGHQDLIHCTGAYCDELPGKPMGQVRTQDIWMFGLAQPFSTVSPEMFEEFEVETSMPLFERFGLVYYGCCDPLDKKMDEVKRIKHVRKISMSPWANEARGAEAIGGDYVFSRKPNPALLATTGRNENEIRKHLQTTFDICRRFGCPLEFILKDISTVKGDVGRLVEYGKIVMEVVNG